MTAVDEIKDNVLLKVEDLKTQFFVAEGVVKAVDGVSFHIKRDEVLGLVGETGCGKSVTALSILQLIRSPGQIVGGKIVFNGEDMVMKSQSDMLDYRGKTITMIFQDPLNSLNPVLKVGKQVSEVFLLHQKQGMLEELAELKKGYEENKPIRKTLRVNVRKLTLKKIFGSLTEEEENQLGILEKKYYPLKKIYKRFLRLNDVAWKRSAELLERIGLPDSWAILDRYPHELSGGMRQRVMIAMALACNAELLICDEPTTALDVTIQAQILELIKELKLKFHNSILFITHSLGVIYEVCDRVAVMYSGNIVEYGDVESIFDKPQHPYTIGLLNAIPRVIKEDREKDLMTIPGMVPNLIYPPPGCRFHPRCTHAMKICRKINPALVEQENGVMVACHLFHEKDPKEEANGEYEILTNKEKKEFSI